MLRPSLARTKSLQMYVDKLPVKDKPFRCRLLTTVVFPTEPLYIWRYLVRGSSIFSTSECWRVLILALRKEGSSVSRVLLPCLVNAPREASSRPLTYWKMKIMSDQYRRGPPRGARGLRKDLQPQRRWQHIAALGGYNQHRGIMSFVRRNVTSA